MDETILPVDHDRGGGQILDDEIHTLMVKPLVRGVRLTGTLLPTHLFPPFITSPTHPTYLPL